MLSEQSRLRETMLVNGGGSHCKEELLQILYFAIKGAMYTGHHTAEGF